MIKLFPSEGEIPRTPFFQKKDASWVYTDSKSWRKKNNISYSWNEEGYRADSFQNRSDLNILSIGSGITFGVGLPAEYTWPAMFCDTISKQTNQSVSNWNMAWYGKSISYCARIIAYAAPILKPDLVLIQTPDIFREEQAQSEDEVYDLGANTAYTRDAKVSSWVHAELEGFHTELVHELDAQRNFLTKLKWISVALNEQSIPWHWFASKPEQLESIKHLAEPENVIDVSIKQDDSARDELHLGPQSMKAIADQIANQLKL